MIALRNFKDAAGVRFSIGEKLTSDKTPKNLDYLVKIGYVGETADNLPSVPSVDAEHHEFIPTQFTAEYKSNFNDEVSLQINSGAIVLSEEAEQNLDDVSHKDLPKEGEDDETAGEIKVPESQDIVTGESEDADSQAKPLDETEDKDQGESEDEQEDSEVETDTDEVEDETDESEVSDEDNESSEDEKVVPKKTTTLGKRKTRSL